MESGEEYEYIIEDVSDEGDEETQPPTPPKTQKGGKSALKAETSKQNVAKARQVRQKAVYERRAEELVEKGKKLGVEPLVEVRKVIVTKPKRVVIPTPQVEPVEHEPVVTRLPHPKPKNNKAEGVKYQLLNIK